jgi:hypothetical protein
MPFISNNVVGSEDTGRAKIGLHLRVLDAAWTGSRSVASLPKTSVGLIGLDLRTRASLRMIWFPLLALSGGFRDEPILLLTGPSQKAIAAVNFASLRNSERVIATAA